MSSRVKDVMTTRVLTVRPEAPFKHVVNLLTGYGVSALPVVDEQDRPLGVVSEADLLVKEEYPGGEAPSPLAWLRHRADRRRAASGTTAADFMRSPAITIGPEAGLSEAARRMHAAGVKRLLVVDGSGRLIGLVTRGDLLKPFIRSDETIHREVIEDVLAGQLGIGPGQLDVAVRDGVVTISGTVARRSQTYAIPRLVSRLDGVVRVDAQLGWEEDDLAAERVPLGWAP